MRSFTSSVGVLVAFVSIGCGTTVTVREGEDGTSSGGGGEGGSTSSVVSDGGGPPVPVNPAGCPSGSPSEWTSCPEAALACSYLEAEGCTVAYLCTPLDGCYGETAAVGSGTGGYDTSVGSGGCQSDPVWLVQSAECPAAIACDAAVTGDICATPGESCSGDYGECSYEQKTCGADHRWTVSSYKDECCYDDCCYGECECWSDECPASVPLAGDPCDPCYDGASCSYPIETECGTLYAYASCSWSTYTWEVESSGCAGTGGSGGGWDTTVASTGVSSGGTGGWDGSGGFLAE